ncbi:hypothetical protein [Streptomyces sp. NPDC046985]|uniref:hypothetical protein n=1 Tax=Streptomyces sp. NPDC046985 TaxID=3155377 RepID=UPI0033F21F1A
MPSSAYADAATRRPPPPGPLGSAPDAVGRDFALAVAEAHAALTADEGAQRERALRDSVLAAYESVARTMHATATVQQGELDAIGQATQNPGLMG